MSEKKPYPYLAPCPFCTLDLNAVAEVDGGHIDLVYPAGGIDSTLYQVVCPEHAGGCNASILGGSRKEAIAAWNRRVAFQRPYGLISDMTTDGLYRSYMELNEILKEYMSLYQKAVEREFIADKRRKAAERRIEEKIAAMASLIKIMKELA